MSKERLEEFKDYIDFLDDSQDMQDHGRFVDTLHSLYEDGWFDWIYLYAKEQDERVKEYEYRYNKHLDLDIKNHDKIRQLEQQNKRYREFIKTISDPWEVARKIVKGTNKKGASAEEIVAWIEREAERILEGEE